MRPAGSWSHEEDRLMSYALTLTIAGLDALVDAQNSETEAIRVTAVGFTDNVVTIAPTLTALPGEFKRIDTVSGIAVSETIIHMTAQDASEDTYSIRAFGLYLADGTLFAVYGQATPIAIKTPLVQMQIAFDIAFQDAIAGDIEFGNATFLLPPATETVKGVAEIATQAEVDAGEDDERIVTALKLAARLAPIIQALIDEEQARIAGDAAEAAARESQGDELADLIAALTARTITGGGLATGGGSLAANRVITVLAASAAQMLAGTSGSVALTPAALGPIVKSFSQNGYIALALGDPANALCIQWGRISVAPNTTSSVSFPVAFSECWTAVADGTSNLSPTAEENYPAILPDSILTLTGFLVFSARDVIEPINWIAIGKVNLA